MSDLPYMPFYADDYMADAGFLPTIGHGAYMLLLLNYWQRQEPLPADDFTLQGITKLSDADWERLKPHLARFFQEREGKWHHKRVDEEMARAKEKIELARSKGRASGERRRNTGSTPVEQRFNSGSTPVQHRLNQTPTIEGKGKGKSTTRLSSDEESRRSTATTTTEIFDEKEIERRCVEATGWQFTNGMSALVDLVCSGVSLEDRVLPILRELKGKDGIVSWVYAVKAIEDRERQAKPCSKPVEMTFVPVGSAAWNALLAAGKRESFLRGQCKRAPDGTEALPWPVRDLPTIQTQSAA